MSERAPVVAIFGATGTGKTAFACALADVLPASLISCDSMQLYRGLDAASAKPEGDELRHPWALIDWLPPDAPANLGAWVREAERLVDGAFAAGRIPVVVGGTGLYLRGLLKGVAPAPPREPAVRARLDRLVERHGPAILHRLLTRLDPPLAARLAPADRQRLVRGLEVRVSTRRRLSDIQAGQWSGPDLRPTVRLGLAIDRRTLYERLDARVLAFFERGLVLEVSALRERFRLTPGEGALAGIGYSEVAEWLDGRSKAHDEAALIALVQRNTRRYAKRQMTWFRREPDTLWLDPRAPDALQRALDHVRARQQV